MSPEPLTDCPRPASEPARLQLARLADQPDLPLPEVFRRVCEAAADALRVERAGVWLFVNGDKALRCVSLYERSKRKHSKGASLTLATGSAYLQAVHAAPLLACEFARTDPRTAELGDTYLTPNGITSLLDAPLMRDDRLAGLVRHEHVGPPRDWTDADRSLARFVADLVVARMRAAEGALRAPPKPPPPHPAPAPAPSRPTASVPPPPAESNREHDFRAVFAEILANTELIALIPNLAPGVTDRLGKISAAVGRGVALLRGLLDSVPAAAATEDGTGDHEPVAPPRPTPRSPKLDDDTGEHDAVPPAQPE